MTSENPIGTQLTPTEEKVLWVANFLTLFVSILDLSVLMNRLTLEMVQLLAINLVVLAVGAYAFQIKRKVRAAWVAARKQEEAAQQEAPAEAPTEDKSSEEKPSE